MKANSFYNFLVIIIICADVRGVKSVDVRAATVLQFDRGSYASQNDIHLPSCP